MSKNDMWNIHNLVGANKSEVVMKNLLILFIIFFTIQVYAREDEVPSWVQGIRSGQEGIKLVIGNKIFYRRQVANIDDDKNTTCQKAIEATEESLKAEITFDVKIPYTLELIFYDEKIKDCSVTISVAPTLMNKLFEIEAFKKNEKKERATIEARLKESKAEKNELELKNKQLNQLISDNRDLFDRNARIDSNYERALSITSNRYAKAEMFAITGLRVREFQSLIGEKVEINFDQDSICNKKENKVYSSNHAGLNVCWSDKYGLPEIVSFCHDNQCFVRNNSK